MASFLKCLDSSLNQDSLQPGGIIGCNRHMIDADRKDALALWSEAKKTKHFHVDKRLTPSGNVDEVYFSTLWLSVLQCLERVSVSATENPELWSYMQTRNIYEI